MCAEDGAEKVVWCNKFHQYVSDFFNNTSDTYQHQPWLVGFQECFQDYTGGTMLGSCISLSNQAAHPFLKGFALLLQAMAIAMAEAQSCMLENALGGKLSCCPSSVPTSNTWLSYDVRHLIQCLTLAGDINITGQCMTLAGDVNITGRISDVSNWLVLPACYHMKLLTHERCR